MYRYNNCIYNFKNGKHINLGVSEIIINNFFRDQGGYNDVPTSFYSWTKDPEYGHWICKAKVDAKLPDKLCFNIPVQVFRDYDDYTLVFEKKIGNVTFIDYLDAELKSRVYFEFGTLLGHPIGITIFKDYEIMRFILKHVTNE